MKPKLCFRTPGRPTSDYVCSKQRSQLLLRLAQPYFRLYQCRNSRIGHPVSRNQSHRRHLSNRRIDWQLRTRINHLAQTINEMMEQPHPYRTFSVACGVPKFCWENEEKILFWISSVIRNNSRHSFTMKKTRKSILLDFRVFLCLFIQLLFSGFEPINKVLRIFIEPKRLISGFPLLSRIT